MNENFKINKIAKSNIWNIFILTIVLANTSIVIFYFVVNEESFTEK